MKIFGGFVFVFVGLAKSCLGEVVVIGKPEFHCGSNGEIVELRREVTEIRLPRNTAAWFSINTERSLKCTEQQRSVLMTWKIIRDFEMYLNSNFNNTGSNGIIYFKNDMVMPGFNYLIHVILKDNNKIQEKDFNVTFFNAEDNENTLKAFGHLDLIIGTNQLYTTQPIIINANVTLCGYIVYYYFQWSIINKDNQIVILPEKSSKLIIPPSSELFGNKELCVIQCKVLDLENNASILEESTKIYIDKMLHEENELQVLLPFKHSTYNKGAPIYIRPYIQFRNLDYKTEWSCMFENTLLYDCHGQINTGFYMEAGFKEEGNYSISLTVRTSHTERTATCSILVRSGGPSIEFDLVYPIRPDKGIEIHARIYELRTYCTVRWFEDPASNHELNEIPGFKEIYNVSSIDKYFLEEIVELGSLPVTKQIKLKIPPPSRTWRGLESKNYFINLAVTCPSLQEINDMGEIKDQPSDFATIIGQTYFFVPVSPTVQSVDVIFEHNDALSSQYDYIVQKSNGENHTSMIYKYGFTLKDTEVVFYTGIDVFSAKSILPFNEDAGVETYVEFCDYLDRCGKHFGPLIKPNLNYSLDQQAIVKAFKQKLAEEDFYEVFAYAFIVQHSASYINQSQIYSSFFSTELSTKLEQILEINNKLVINDFIKNFVIFVDHLKLSDDLMTQLSELIHGFLADSQHPRRLPRYVSRKVLSSSKDFDKLEDIQYYMKTSECLILNLISNESVEREKDHLIDLLDKWMVQACKMLFTGQRVPDVEMKTVIFSIEKISEQILNKLILVPFDSSPWNLTVNFKISNLSSQNSLCLGRVMLKNFFSKEDVTFGANVYSGDDKQADVKSSANITIFISKSSDSKAFQCSVYKNGCTLDCSSPKQYANFVECICPTFGYYLLNISFFKENDEILNNTENTNQTHDYSDNMINESARRLGQQISYVIIISSLGGFLILCYIIKKLTVFPQQNVILDGFNDNYHYGQAMTDDFLT